MAYGLVLYIVQSPGTIEISTINGFASSGDATTAGDALVTAFKNSYNSVKYGVISGLQSNGGAITYADVDSGALASAADIAAGTASKLVDAATLTSAETPVALTDAATIAVDANLGKNFTLTLTGDHTLGNPTNMAVGDRGWIRITQDGSGSHTLAYGDNWNFAGGTEPTVTATAAAVSIIFYHKVNTSMIACTSMLDVKI